MLADTAGQRLRSLIEMVGVSPCEGTAFGRTIKIVERHFGCGERGDASERDEKECHDVRF